MSKRNRNRGKRHERNIAKLLNGKRLGVLGKHDVENETYSIECKSREKLPKWFQQMWEQAVRNCEEDKIPLLVIHKLRQKYLDDWVVIRLEDFLKIKGWDK
jgi:calcineurin-like phosphoesterase family protein